MVEVLDGGSIFDWLRLSEAWSFVAETRKQLQQKQGMMASPEEQREYLLGVAKDNARFSPAGLAFAWAALELMKKPPETIGSWWQAVSEVRSEDYERWALITLPLFIGSNENLRGQIDGFEAAEKEWQGWLAQVMLRERLDKNDGWWLILDRQVGREGQGQWGEKVGLVRQMGDVVGAVFDRHDTESDPGAADALMKRWLAMVLCLDGRQMKRQDPYVLESRAPILDLVWKMFLTDPEMALKIVRQAPFGGFMFVDRWLREEEHSDRAEMVAGVLGELLKKARGGDESATTYINTMMTRLLPKPVGKLEDGAYATIYYEIKRFLSGESTVSKPGAVVEVFDVSGKIYPIFGKSERVVTYSLLGKILIAFLNAIESV